MSFNIESEVETYLKERCESCGYLCVKLSPDAARGIPDRMVVTPGRVIFVETKREKGRLSPSQIVWKEKLRRLDQQVFTAWSRSDVDELLTGLTSSEGN